MQRVSRGEQRELVVTSGSGQKVKFRRQDIAKIIDIVCFVTLLPRFRIISEFSRRFTYDTYPKPIVDMTDNV